MVTSTEDLHRRLDAFNQAGDSLSARSAVVRLVTTEVPEDVFAGRDVSATGTAVIAGIAAGLATYDAGLGDLLGSTAGRVLPRRCRADTVT